MCGVHTHTHLEMLKSSQLPQISISIAKHQNFVDMLKKLEKQYAKYVELQSKLYSMCFNTLNYTFLGQTENFSEFFCMCL